MKKNDYRMCIILVAVTLCTIFTSCGDSNDMQNSALSTTVYKQQNSLLANADFWNSFDSINDAKEKLKTSRSLQTRGVGDMPTVKNDYTEVKANNRIGRKFADQVGRFAGGLGGKWAGGIVGGALTENPAGLWLGKTIGKQVGKYVGGIVSSYLADIYNNHNNVAVNPNIPGQAPTGGLWPDKLPSPGVAPSTPTTSEDSIGIIHNKIMAKLTANKSKYIKNNNINTNQIYLDCVQYLKQEGIYNDTISYDLEYRRSVIDYALKVASDAVECYNGKISGNDVLDRGIKLLKEKYSITEDEALTIKRLCLSVTDTATGMSLEQAQDYTDCLNAVIIDSDMSTEQKANMSSFVNLAISSSLYWDNIEPDSLDDK